MILPQIGQEWKHFKGSKYKIVGFSWDAEGDSPRLSVQYKLAELGNYPIFSRTLFNFLGPVDTRASARFVKIA